MMGRFGDNNKVFGQDWCDHRQFFLLFVTSKEADFLRCVKRILAVQKKRGRAKGERVRRWNVHISEEFGDRFLVGATEAHLHFRFKSSSFSCKLLWLSPFLCVSSVSSVSWSRVFTRSPGTGPHYGSIGGKVLLQLPIGKVNFFAQYGAASNQISQLIILIVIAIVHMKIINIKTISHNEEEKKSPLHCRVCDLYNGSNMSPRGWIH